jgi:hypothetical protein
VGRGDDAGGLARFGRHLVAGLIGASIAKERNARDEEDLGAGARPALRVSRRAA